MRQTSSEAELDSEQQIASKTVFGQLRLAGQKKTDPECARKNAAGIKWQRLSAILTSSARDRAFIFRMIWPR
jgi:hypothetical protein